MKNRYVSEFKGDFESAFKNGEFRQILVFGGLSNSFMKVLNSNVPIKKEVEPTDKIPYKYTLLKFRSPFRIGEQMVKLFNFENVVSRNLFNEEEFKNIIVNFCKNFKNSITLIPINGAAIQYRREIENILEKNVIGAKFVIIS